jgi:hypothetical protein
VTWLVWLIFGVILAAMAMLAYPAVRAFGSAGKLSRDAGWKRVFPGVYRTGPYGGPYVEPDEAQSSASASTEHSPTRGKRLSPRGQRRLVVSVLLLWLLLAVLGVLVGLTLAPDDSHRLAGGVIGAVMASFVWVVLCWVIGFGLRRALIKRGYSVPGAPGH